ncbi:MAG: T9SS type A sorting domain-containing protein [Muribaculaceae bacterium]|nr:T9SS type A sorting domain-containing protein [Muribaculaceae bacterium]
MAIFKDMRLIGFAALLSAAIIASPLPANAAKGWEPVKTERADAKSVVRESELEIKAANGMIQVNTNHPVQIKIFTILGRLISSDTIPAGKSQFVLPVHGVYIVKVGDITCKVAV